MPRPRTLRLAAGVLALVMSVPAIAATGAQAVDADLITSVSIGDPVISQVLRGTVVPAAGGTTDVTYSYEWSTNGIVVQTATTASTESGLTMQWKDFGARFDLTVTATRSDGATETVVAPTSQPAVDFRVGAVAFDAETNRFTLADPRLSPIVPATMGGASATYTWLRDGVPLAADPDLPWAHTRVAADNGHTLAVRIDLAQPATGAQRSVTSASTQHVGVAQVSLVLNGTAASGQTLTLDPQFVDAYPPIDMLDVRLDCDFQWYRNGAALTGETDWQHGVHTMERGTVLQARSVCRIPGYLPVTSWSRKLTIAGVPALVSFLGNDALRDVAILEQPRFQQLWLVRASSAGRYPAGSMQGFNNFDMSGLTSLGLGGDLDDDGREDLVGRDRSGVLWAYTAGDRRFKLGSGWNGMDLIVTGGDVTKDRVADVYARRRSDGALLFYPGRARLGLASGRVVTTGLRTAVRIVTIGDANGDGIADLHATFPNGDLYFYPGRIDGGLGARVRVGTGWSGMTALLAGRDLNQDGKADLLGRDAKGNLWLYAGNGRGGLTSRVLTNSGNPLPAKVY